MIVPSQPCYHVVAALLERDGRYLITQRRPDARLPLLWEFPGGRVEPGESDAEALGRELRERLGCEVEVGDLVLHVTHHYDGYCVELWVHRCTLLRGEPVPLKVHDVRWVDLDDLGSYPFPCADQETVDALLEDEHRFS